MHQRSREKKDDAEVIVLKIQAEEVSIAALSEPVLASRGLSYFSSRRKRLIVIS
jgi:hypothetical protein